MISNTSRLLPASVAAAVLAACGGGSGSGSAPTLSTPQSANIPLVLSDASNEDWATIGVQVLSIALVPQGGGSAVDGLHGPLRRRPCVNLEQLDQIARDSRQCQRAGRHLHRSGAHRQRPIAGDVDVSTVSADPESGLPAPAGSTIAADQIQVQGIRMGSAGSSLHRAHRHRV